MFKNIISIKLLKVSIMGKPSCSHYTRFCVLLHFLRELKSKNGYIRNYTSWSTRFFFPKKQKKMRPSKNELLPVNHWEKGKINNHKECIRSCRKDHVSLRGYRRENKRNNDSQRRSRIYDWKVYYLQFNPIR